MCVCVCVSKCECVKGRGSQSSKFRSVLEEPVRDLSDAVVAQIPARKPTYMCIPLCQIEIQSTATGYQQGYALLMVPICKVPSVQLTLRKVSLASQPFTTTKGLVN